MSAEGDARFTTIKAKLARLKIPATKQKQNNLSIHKLHHLQEDQNMTRAVPAGFHEDTTRARSKRLADKHDNRSRYVIRKEYKEQKQEDEKYGYHQPWTRKRDSTRKDWDTSSTP